MFHPPIKINQFLGTVKNALGLKTVVVYKIPCTCGKSYIGQTGCSIEIIYTKHKQCNHLGHREESALANMAEKRDRLFCLARLLYFAQSDH